MTAGGCTTRIARVIRIGASLERSVSHHAAAQSAEAVFNVPAVDRRTTAASRLNVYAGGNLGTNPASCKPPESCLGVTDRIFNSLAALAVFAVVNHSCHEQRLAYLLNYAR